MANDSGVPPKKRVLVVHQHSGPGTFHDLQRGPMYRPLFEKAGFSVDFVGRRPVAPFSHTGGRVGKALRRSLFVNVAARAYGAAATTISDARLLAIAPRYDVIILITAESPRLVRALRKRTSARIVYDLADSVWRDARGEDRPEMLKMLEEVDAITVNTDFAYQFAKRFGPPVYMWPTAAYVEAFDARRAASRRDKDGSVVIGWIGSHTTVSNLYLALESLEDVARRHPNVRLRILGIPFDHEIIRRFERMRPQTRSTYSTEEMIGEVLDMDIGLYPMYDLDDSGMHGVTKAIIYMAGGAVVVGSPVHDRVNLIEEGKTGFFAQDRREWTEKLDRLIVDAQLRADVRERALEHVRQRYTLERCFASMRPALGD